MNNGEIYISPLKSHIIVVLQNSYLDGYHKLNSGHRTVQQIGPIHQGQYLRR